MEPDISCAALIIVDMQHDFLHPDGAFGRRARRQPERLAGMSLLAATIPMVKRLLDGFRDAGRPIVHNITTFQPDYADAQLRHGRHGLTSDGQALLLEGSWGAQIVDELAPRRGEYVVAKKGYGGFANPALNTILRFRGVTTCVVAGVTTAICVSSTIRGGVEYNYRMVLVEDAVAEQSREMHEAEVKILERGFADVTSTREVVAPLERLDPREPAENKAAAPPAT
jgi:nicotinamidase-related amidase